MEIKHEATTQIRVDHLEVHVGHKVAHVTRTQTDDCDATVVVDSVIQGVPTRQFGLTVDEASDVKAAVSNWKPAERKNCDVAEVLQWVYQQSAGIVPAKLHDLAARALGEPSLAHGQVDVEPENWVCIWHSFVVSGAMDSCPKCVDPKDECAI